MNADQAVDWLREGLSLLLVVSLPAMATALVVGLAVSLLQAVTQVTDPTLSFVPKILAVVVVLGLGAQWMISMLVEFAERMFSLP